MEAPAWFARELRAFDSDLRIRWSRRLQLWQIERRVRRGLHPGTIRNDGWHDDFIRAQDGYMLVASARPGKLGRSIFQKLRDSDLWANGGWQKVADELEAAEERAEEKHWENFGADVRSMSAEVFRFLQHRNGQVIFNAGLAS